GTQFSAVAAGYQHYFVNGKIDTLTISQGGSIIARYKGKVKNNMRHTSIVGFSITQNDSLDKIVFIQDKNYRDSVVMYSAYQGGQFEMLFEARINYATTGQPSVIDIYADLGFGLMKVGDYNYFYKNGLVDSLYYTVSFTGQNDGYFKYHYDPANSNRLLYLDGYEDVDNDGEKDHIQRLLFKNNQLNQVVEVTDLSADNNLN